MLVKKPLPNDLSGYIREQINYGESFAKLLSALPLEKGSIFTFLPQNIDVAEIEDFSLSLELTRGFGTWSESSLNYLVGLVTDYLSNTPHAFVVSESFDDITSVERGLVSRPFFLFENVVYYFCANADDLNLSVENALKFGRSYPSICAVGSFVENCSLRSGEILSTEKIKNIVNSIKYIIVGAYDEEGYIIWENPTLNNETSSSNPA